MTGMSVLTPIDLLRNKGSLIEDWNELINHFNNGVREFITISK
jgi:hypothetical protein